jgi:hypothetical protein
MQSLINLYNPPAEDGDDDNEEGAIGAKLVARDDTNVDDPHLEDVMADHLRDVLLVGDRVGELIQRDKTLRREVQEVMDDGDGPVYEDGEELLEGGDEDSDDDTPPPDDNLPPAPPQHTKG